MSQELRTKNAKAAGVVGLAVFCSRILGLVREVIFSRLFGGGREMDAFTVAFRTPNLLRDLFAEGALSTAFITIFSRKIATEGDEAAWVLARKVATLAVIFMSGVVVVGIAISPQLIGVLAPGFDPEKAALTVLLARVMYPFILLVSLGALVMGMLNAKSVFGVPAMASSFFNIGSIFGGVLIGWWIDPSFGSKALMGLACGTLVGGAMQLGVQLPSLRKIGFRFKPDFNWRDDGVTSILRMMGPAIIAASSVQVNVMINTWFASWLEDGTAYRLNVAFRLMQLPLGVFGVAIGTVTLPLLSRLAATEQRGEFRGALAQGMRMAFVLTIPATLGLLFLARPILGLIYEHGKFNAHAADQAAFALQGYALGLCAYSALKVLTPAFYAIDRRKTPMVVSFISIVLNIVFNWLLAFHFHMGIRGLALATGGVALANFVILYALMRRETRLLETRFLLHTFLKLAPGTLALGAVCWFGSTWISAGWGAWSFWLRAVALFGVIGLGGSLYFLFAWMMRVEEVQTILGTVLRRRRRSAE